MLSRPFRLICGALAALGAYAAGPASAHPHVWIDNITTIIFEDGKVTGVRVRWTFDELFGSGVIKDYDKNGDGKFDAAEIRVVKAEAFAALADYGYFVNVFVGGKPLKAGAAKDFKPSVNKSKQLVYEFTVPFPEAIDPKAPGFKIGIYDPSFYVYVGPDDSDPVRFAGMKDGACQYKIVEDKEHPIYFDSVFPPVIKLDCAAG